jgi:hypothetical protein
VGKDSEQTAPRQLPFDSIVAAYPATIFVINPGNHSTHHEFSLPPEITFDYGVGAARDGSLRQGTDIADHEFNF